MSALLEQAKQVALVGPTKDGSPRISKTKLTELIQKCTRDNSPNGVNALFVPINEEWGFKFYTSPSQARRSKRVHKKFAKLGLAPRVGRSINMPEIQCFGYLVEKVEIARNWIMEQFGVTEEDNRNRTNGVWENNMNSMWKMADELECSEEMQELKRNLRNHGFRFSDSHWGNWGWLRGQMVCIDFV